MHYTLLRLFLITVLLSLPLLALAQETNHSFNSQKPYYIEQAATLNDESLTIETKIDSVNALKNELEIDISYQKFYSVNLDSYLSEYIRNVYWDVVDLHHLRHRYFFYHHVFTHQHLHANRFINLKN